MGRACAKIADKDENFKIDENERKAMIACLKESAKTKHKPPSKKEIKCKKEADLDKNGKIEAEEIEAFEKCMGMKPGKKKKKKITKKKATKALKKVTKKTGKGKRVTPMEKACG